MNIRGYYFITDTSLTKAGNTPDVAAAVAAGARAVQYRVKNLNTASMVAEAERLKRSAQGALFLVNDRIDVALAVEADGVHLGQEDMPYAHARRILGPGKVIGITVHTVDQARAAQTAGADYVGISPVFATQTKLDAGIPGGLRLVHDIRAAVRVPIVAIGGITLENAPKVIAAGADAVCAISAVVTSDDVEEAVKKFQKLF